MDLVARPLPTIPFNIRLLMLLIPLGMGLSTSVLRAQTGEMAKQTCVAGELVPASVGMGRVPPEMLSSFKECGKCHVQEEAIWAGGFRPHTFNSPFVQAEYNLVWKLAQEPGNSKDLVASCVACHSPLAYLKGTIPKPGDQSLAKDEGISCDFCHSTWGFRGNAPGQFNWVYRNGGGRFGPQIDSASGHRVEWVRSAEFCGTCHNEMGPGGFWVKSVYNEWREGPKAPGSQKGCRDCHTSFTRESLNDLIRGAVDITINPDQVIVAPNGQLTVSVTLVNKKAGHSIPAGSSELRQLWLHLQATDGSGIVHPLVLQPKGFQGEEYTIGSGALTYRDAGSLAGETEFLGLPRDGVGISNGDRIFRLPMFDRAGNMTAFEWNAYSRGTDYRLACMQKVEEKYTLHLPKNVPAGALTIRATLSYRRCPPALWSFLHLPADLNPTIQVATAINQVAVEPSPPPNLATAGDAK